MTIKLRHFVTCSNRKLGRAVSLGSVRWPLQIPHSFDLIYVRQTRLKSKELNECEYRHTSSARCLDSEWGQWRHSTCSSVRHHNNLSLSSASSYHRLQAVRNFHRLLAAHWTSGKRLTRSGDDRRRGGSATSGRRAQPYDDEGRQRPQRGVHTTSNQALTDSAV